MMTTNSSTGAAAHRAVARGSSKRLLTSRTEALLRRYLNNWAPLCFLLLLAATVGRTPQAITLRIRCRRQDHLRFVVERLESVLPDGWLVWPAAGKPAQEHSRLLITHEASPALKAEPIGATPLSCIMVTSAPDPEAEEGVLDLMLDEGSEQIAWRARDEAARYTLPGHRRERRFARVAASVRSHIAKRPIGAPVELACAAAMPHFHATPLHLPFVMEVINALCHAIAWFDYPAARDGFVRPVGDVAGRAASLLYLAGAIDRRPDVSVGDLELFTWFREMTPSGRCLTVQGICEHLCDARFLQQLSQNSTAMRRPATNQPLPLHQIRRGMKRLADFGMVEIVDDRTKPHEWRVTSPFREFHPTHLIKALASAAGNRE